MIYILNKQKEKETLSTYRKLNLFLVFHYGQNSKLLSKTGLFTEIPVRFGTIIKTTKLSFFYWKKFHVQNQGKIEK